MLTAMILAGLLNTSTGAGCSLNVKVQASDGTSHTYIRACPTTPPLPGKRPDRQKESGSCAPAGTTLPCIQYGAPWSPAHNCYLLDVTDRYEPLRGTPGPPWEGRDNGSIMQCLSIGPVNFSMPDRPLPVEPFWSEGSEIPPVDGATVAREVLSSMILTAPALEISPNPTAVGFSTWLSVDPAGFTTLTDGTTLGATTVSVVAAPVATRWNLDGTTVDCDGPGERRPEGTHPRDASSCSHMFEASSRAAPDGLPVSATITYEVEWTCEGACVEPSGTLGRTQGRVATTDVVVHELAAQLVR